MIALIITSDGFPLAYEVMEVDPSDRTTLRGFLEKIEKTCGKAKRTCVMDLDRGFPPEEVLEDMRKPGRERFCREGAPKGKIKNTRRNGWICWQGIKIRTNT